MVNPYAKYLGDRNPFEVVGSTPERLLHKLQSLGPEKARVAPAPGKWSVREILCHLADCEIVFAFRLRQTIAEDHHIIQPFDQDHWAKAYAAYDSAEALAAFSAVRHWNLLFLKSLTAEVYHKKVSHPERGEGTLQIIVDTMAGHDLNHLAQLRKISEASAVKTTEA